MLNNLFLKKNIIGDIDPNNSTITYRELIDKDSWPLQAAVDALSFGEDIPILLINKNAFINDVKNYIYAGTDNDNFIASNIDNLDFKSFFSHIKEKHQNNTNNFLDEFYSNLLNLKIYFTIHSNLPSLFDYFRENIAWRCWEIIWLFSILIKNNDFDGTITTGAFGLDIFQYSICNGPIPDSLIFIGPVAKPTSKRTGDKLENEILIPSIDLFLSANIDAKDTSFTKIQLLRGGSSINTICDTDLSYRQKNILMSFEILFAMQITSSYRINYLRRCLHSNLAECALFSARFNDNDNPSSDNKKDWPTLFVRIDSGIDDEFAIKDNSPNSDTSNEFRWLAINKKYNLLPSLILYLNSDLENTLQDNKPLTYLKKDFNITSRLKVEYLRARLEALSLRISSRRRLCSLSNTFQLREWINNHFITQIDEAHKQSKIYKEISMFVSNTIRADTCALYRHNCANNSAELLGLYSTDLKYNSDFGNNKTSDLMKNAGASLSQDERSKSIVYRSIDTGFQKMTRMYDNQLKRSVPENEPLLPPIKGFKAHRSAISTPLLVNGRIWGALEIDGFHPYQFRWADKSIASQFADILSPFLYRVWYMGLLHDLNKTILSSGSLNFKYLTICRFLSNFFMSNGSSLWVRDFSQLYKYSCVAAYNTPSIEVILKESEGSLYYTNADKDFLSSKLVQSNTDDLWYQGEIGQGELNISWLEAKTYRKVVFTENKHLTVIAIKSPIGNETIATLSLYNRKPDNYSDSWLGYITFITRHVALLLEAMHAEEGRIRINQQFFQHELKQRMDILYQQSINLIGYLRRIGIKDRRIDTFYNDFKLYTDSIRKILIAMHRSEIEKWNDLSELPIYKDAEYTFKNVPPETINLRSLFNQAIRPHYKIRVDNLISVNFLDPNRIGFVVMHQDNLLYIITNLVTNAIKYSVPGSTIEAETYSYNNTLFFKIANIGHRLDSAEKYKIFTNGFRGSNAKRTSKAGEGKGLFIAKRICELYGIGLSYEQELIEGNLAKHTFRLSFPSTLLPTFRRN